VGDPAETWESFAAGFFTSYCVSCHNEDMTGTATRDYTSLDAVTGEADKIACGVATAALYAELSCSGSPMAFQFPVGSGAKPSDEERERLVAWIEAGMP
jgi:hypothetical protein